MSSIYYLDHQLVELTTNPGEVLTNFIADAQSSRMSYPDCQQLDMAWSLSKSATTDLQLRQLIMPTLTRLKNEMITANKNENPRKLYGFAAHRALAYKKQWLRQVKNSVHFPASVRKYAADLLGESIFGE
ncbi:hypothetical protein FD04_GL001355 [Secundilactobacillus odoratitofui DSM 19909 = JCM 15043]|uniref:Uncharacterized protein n=1 Tax=Secundilactobacillus odoratitofui DSM 19909 = JCM 15043 TaxID=1423776 RepID=A0A0R1LY08_9LACO|nr:hypothetical protein [Secundilactobacillus odoratitofui]KRK97338.1 hypothetical protein FD04_GL001355 [Secundilactobacillus odoratitofui DSM 19909 = JCM 15043]